jgi:hypothetical protein
VRDAAIQGLLRWRLFAATRKRLVKHVLRRLHAGQSLRDRQPGASARRPPDGDAVQEHHAASLSGRLGGPPANRDQPRVLVPVALSSSRGQGMTSLSELAPRVGSEKHARCCAVRRILRLVSKASQIEARRSRAQARADLLRRRAVACWSEISALEASLTALQRGELGRVREAAKSR